MKTHIIQSLITATTLAAAATAVPAMANGPHAYGHGRPVVAPAYVAQQALAGLSEINQRQAVQRARINAGFHRGAITRREFHRLMAEQQAIQARERALVADGFLSPHERAELQHRLNTASSHIFAEAHDYQWRF